MGAGADREAAANPTGGIGRLVARSSLALAVVMLVATSAEAVVSLRHDLDVEGFLETKNAIRTPQFQGAELIMQRNTVQLEGRWEFLRSGNLFGLSTGRLEQGSFTMISRTVYDSVYDVRGSYRDRFTDEERDDLRYEANIREAYGELLLPPVTLRLGRQQVVWGETDFFRALDVINPLDYRWHFYYEPFEDIRVPVSMVRGIYDIGKLPGLDEVFVEGIWIPGDYAPTKISLDPRRPWGFFGQGVRESANTIIIDGQVFDFNTAVTNNGPDFSLENSELAFRIKGLLGPVDLSLNYFWAISDDAGPKVHQDLATVGPAERSGAVGTVVLPVDLAYPRSHVVGLSANYAEEALTQAVFRVESTYTTGVPVSLAADVPRAIDPDGNLYETSERVVLMTGFDRPTWIKPLNQLRTFFLSGQLFWRHYLDFNRFFVGFPSVYPAELNGETLEGRFIQSNTDRLTEDELAVTFLATTSYGPGGLWIPTLLTAYDVVGTAGYTHLEIEHIYSSHLIFRLREAVFWGRIGEGPWFLGDRFGRPGDNRCETVFSVVVQF
jgi:hypothetical protein